MWCVEEATPMSIVFFRGLWVRSQCCTSPCLGVEVPGSKVVRPEVR